MYENIYSRSLHGTDRKFGYSLLARPLRLGSQRVGSPCSVVSATAG